MQYKDCNIQNEDIVRFETFEVIDNKIYAQLIGKNILVQLMPNNIEVKVLNTSDEYRSKHCTYIGDKLYLVDNSGEAFLEYDINLNTFEKYYIDAYVKDDNNIAAVESSDKYVFVVSQYEGKIYIYDSDKKKLEQDKSLQKKITKLYGKMTQCNVRCWKNDKFLYFIINHKNDYYVCRYNMLRMCLEDLSQKIISYSMRTAYCFEHMLYILEDDYLVKVWDLNTNKTQQIEMDCFRQLIDKKELKYTYAFSALVVTQKNLWLFPAGANEDIYVYDLLEHSGRKYEEYPEDFCYLNMENWSKYADMKQREGYIYVAARLSNYYLLINVQTGEGSWEAIGDCDFTEYYADAITNRVKKNQVIGETNINMFKAFLEHDQREIHMNEEACIVGKQIWEKLNE